MGCTENKHAHCDQCSLTFVSCFILVNQKLHFSDSCNQWLSWAFSF